MTSGCPSGATSLPSAGGTFCSAASASPSLVVGATPLPVAADLVPPLGALNHVGAPFSPSRVPGGDLPEWLLFSPSSSDGASSSSSQGHCSSGSSVLAGSFADIVRSKSKAPVVPPSSKSTRSPSRGPGSGVGPSNPSPVVHPSRPRHVASLGSSLADDRCHGRPQAPLPCQRDSGNEGWELVYRRK
jgi:hypothetical protein